MNQLPTLDNRIVWLDVIRAVAMLMVIGVHCIDPFYISPKLGAIPEYTHWADFIRNVSFVCCFRFLSGRFSTTCFHGLPE